MSNQFNHGQRVFDRHGMAAQFVTRLATDKIVVLPLYSYQGKETLGPATEWHEAFIEAPVAIYDEATVVARAVLAELEAKAKAIRDETATLIAHRGSLRVEVENLVTAAKALISRADALAADRLRTPAMPNQPNA